MHVITNHEFVQKAQVFLWESLSWEFWICAGTPPPFFFYSPYETPTDGSYYAQIKVNGSALQFHILSHNTSLMFSKSDSKS